MANHRKIDIVKDIKVRISTFILNLNTGIESLFKNLNDKERIDLLLKKRGIRLSIDRIKDGDWFMSKRTGEIHHCTATSWIYIQSKEGCFTEDNCVKVILDNSIDD